MSLHSEAANSLSYLQARQESNLQPPVLETRQKKPGGKNKGEREGSLPFCRRDRHKDRHTRCDRNLEGG